MATNGRDAQLARAAALAELHESITLRAVGEKIDALDGEEERRDLHLLLSLVRLTISRHMKRRFFAAGRGQ